MMECSSLFGLRS